MPKHCDVCCYSVVDSRRRGLGLFPSHTSACDHTHAKGGRKEVEYSHQMVLNGRDHLLVTSRLQILHYKHCDQNGHPQVDNHCFGHLQVHDHCFGCKALTAVCRFFGSMWSQAVASRSVTGTLNRTVHTASMCLSLLTDHLPPISPQHRTAQSTLV